ncbi:STM4011 family radical SAM protein [Chitinivorax sp. B]|uniref:STM4011 family radical SAM protein n=1 Tax=Chitinivorax sp. B TaxID=2502235 RepID=UPI001484F065|nr:STM4011 family radical SAM protein [Chitinivorax sp. B]
MRLSLLYRGVLASCNYDCPYCPFAKRKDTRATLVQDASDLARFVDWVAAQSDLTLNLLFTPWGEALTRRHYRDALIRLSHLPQVERVAIQTNLSVMPDWLAQAVPQKVSLWCTYHPGETPLPRFLARIDRLQALGIPHSIGMVGIRRFFADIGALRQQLPANTYLWINAYWDEGRQYYSADEATWLSQIDPWFDHNLNPPPSQGTACRAGELALSVDGQGNVKPCHFVSEPLGNLYCDDWRQRLRSKACPNTLCDCYIGYVHQYDQPFAEEYGMGALGRVPLQFDWQPPAGWSATGPANRHGRAGWIRLHPA